MPRTPFADDPCPRQLPEVLVFANSRWDDGIGRPQQLLTRFARDSRVCYWEEPVFDANYDWLEVRDRRPGVLLLTPHLRPRPADEAVVKAQTALVNRFVIKYGLSDPLLWYYAPAALAISSQLPRAAAVYDCVDDLISSDGRLRPVEESEERLLLHADVVFSAHGGVYEGKAGGRARVHLLPDGVEEESAAASLDPPHSGAASWEAIWAQARALLSETLASKAQNQVAAIKKPTAARSSAPRRAKAPVGDRAAVG